MSFPPSFGPRLRLPEKLYAGVVLFHGSVQAVLYYLQGATFLVGFGMGVWVSLVVMACVFAAIGRAREKQVLPPEGGVAP